MPVKTYQCNGCEIAHIDRIATTQRAFAGRTFAYCDECAAVFDANMQAKPTKESGLRDAMQDLAAKLDPPAIQSLRRIQLVAETWSRYDFNKGQALNAAGRLREAMREISDQAIDALRTAGIVDIPKSAEVESDMSDSLRKPYTGPGTHDPRQG
jgi:hypothetical protein